MANPIVGKEYVLKPGERCISCRDMSGAHTYLFEKDVFKCTEVGDGVVILEVTRGAVAYSPPVGHKYSLSKESFENNMIEFVPVEDKLEVEDL